MLRSTSVVITTTGASPLIALSPVSRPTLAGAVPVDQVVVLLVGQRLDRRGVEALAALGQRQVHRELADHRLAGPGRRADQHAAALLQRLARLVLERVELERQDRRELRQRGEPGAPAGRGYRSAGLVIATRLLSAATVVAIGVVQPLGMVHGVPPSSRPAPVDAVLFDFHGTIAQVEDPVEWVLAAAATCGVALDRDPRDRRWPTAWSPPAGPAGRARAGSRPTWPRSRPTATWPRPRTGPRTRGWPRRSSCPWPASPRPSTTGCCVRRAGGRIADTVPTLQALHAAGIPVAVRQQHRLRHPPALRGARLRPST